jgi:hypothetical protein
MIPHLEDYKILKMNGLYWTMHPYDLFASPALIISGEGHKTIEEAKERIKLLYELHTGEYERLKKRGRDFPDND